MANSAFTSGLSLENIIAHRDTTVGKYSAEVDKILKIKDPTLQDQLQLQFAIQKFTISVSVLSNVMDAVTTSTRGVVNNFNS
jgi:hypothetical protein